MALTIIKISIRKRIIILMKIRLIKWLGINKIDKIDSYKTKYFKLSRTLENQLNNLKFNC